MTSFFYYRVAVTNFNHLFPSPTPSGLRPLIISRFRSAFLCTRVTWLYFFFCYWKYGRLRRCLKLVRVLKWLSQVSTLLFFNIFKWLVIALGPYSRFFSMMIAEWSALQHSSCHGTCHVYQTPSCDGRRWRVFFPTVIIPIVWIIYKSLRVGKKTQSL